MTAIVLARTDADLGAEYGAYITILEGRYDKARAEMADLLYIRENAVEQLKQHRDRAMTCLRMFYKHAQDYFNQCLAVRFRESWSLDEDSCIQLRILLDIVELNTRAAAHLRTARYKLTSIRCTQRRIERQIQDTSAALPDTLSRHLDSIRTATFADELNAAQAEVKALEEEIADRNSLIERCLNGAMDDYIEALLERATRGESPGGRNDTSRESLSAVDRTEDVWDALSTPPGSSNLLDEFEDAREALEDLQIQSACELGEMRKDGLQVSHLITFSKSTPAFLAARIETRRQTLLQELGRAEQRFETSRNNLLASGQSVPPSTPRPQKVPTGGGLGSQAPGSSDLASRVTQYNDKMRKKGRRLNKWRFNTQGDAPRSQVSEARVAKSNRSSPSRSGFARYKSGSESISPLRKQKLDEYKKEQARLRGEA
ncbi:unnamed protein product [Zymoseptoria tritici ST99CH_1A5]|uniref:Uncharacterized protein n=3 Tax=Zymoseptoria tritici TaxID=1047171 RepID=A0A1X7S1R6_ZYMT9|nr:unnamed protein product [Zymoseptoria tritici ST99CH_3D7]SMR57207.1 unnamed protein product [Zymoseptoria tritici ST99CH_1E4]SMR60081.1 unnamed protein product [Zymoseptoria tritici ST99CH_3D1]SMY27266.1 unnamed protein product [Zymoseptoria tritici ST99CH_1A5]